MRLCSIPDCSKEHDSLGYCSSHSHRFRRYGDPLCGGSPYGSAKRFLEEVVLTYEGTECLDWPYSKSPYGYGQIRKDGKLLSVHRIACEALHGPPPASYLDAAHSCGRGHLGCVTKRHLSWKTRRENFLDRIAHGTRGKKLSVDHVLQIRAMDGKHSHAHIARLYGIAEVTVARIMQRKIWADIP